MTSLAASASSSSSRVLLMISEDFWRSGLLICGSDVPRPWPCDAKDVPLLSADLAGMSLLWWAGAEMGAGVGVGWGGSTHSAARSCPEACRL